MKEIAGGGGALPRTREVHIDAMTIRDVVLLYFDLLASLQHNCINI